ncbi:unnamed protein product, partial [Polarella glacialis]
CWGCRYHEPACISTFQALPKRAGASLCISWEQSLSRLVAAGRSPLIRIWDLNREQLLQSYRHNSMHCVTCTAQCPSGLERCCGGTRGLIFIGRGDGSLLALDARTPKGIVQTHKGVLCEPVSTITPCIQKGMTDHASLVAATDIHGVVDLWDLRSKRSEGSYQLGASSLMSSKRNGAEPIAVSQVPPGCSVIASR